MLTIETDSGTRVKVQTWTGAGIKKALLAWGRANGLFLGKTAKSEGQILRAFLAKKLGVKDEGVRAADSTTRRANDEQPAKNGKGKKKSNGKKLTKKAKAAPKSKKPAKKKAPKPLKVQPPGEVSN